MIRNTHNWKDKRIEELKEQINKLEIDWSFHSFEAHTIEQNIMRLNIEIEQLKNLKEMED